MIKIISNPSEKLSNKLCARPVIDSTRLEQRVNKILSDVKLQGDRAVDRYSKQFDTICESPVTISEALKQSIRFAYRNIKKFHQATRQQSVHVNVMPGISCWTEPRPIERVGLYIPGGSAPLFSTVLMLGVPAKLAGCREIILCSPSSHPAILYAASLCGITNIFPVGGAHAIGAMAFGTKRIPKVDKIFGPGNQYVTIAKQLVQQSGTAIDMPAGPSELLIIADDTATPEFIAADLLSQAEHGPDSQVYLVTTSITLAHKVQSLIKKHSSMSTRSANIASTLGNSRIIVMKSIADCIDFSNRYAPEHLQVMCTDSSSVVKSITNAGSVFIGNYSPVSAGDYCSGTNHTLPTNGFAKSYSGVSVASFHKMITFQKLSSVGLKSISKSIITMAQHEGLPAHANAISARIKKKKNDTRYS